MIDKATTRSTCHADEHVTSYLNFKRKTAFDKESGRLARGSIQEACREVSTVEDHRKMHSWAPHRDLYPLHGMNFSPCDALVALWPVTKLNDPMTLRMAYDRKPSFRQPLENRRKECLCNAIDILPRYRMYLSDKILL